MNKNQKNTLINTIMKFHQIVDDLDGTIDNVYDEYSKDKKSSDINKVQRFPNKINIYLCTSERCKNFRGSDYLLIR